MFLTYEVLIEGMRVRVTCRGKHVVLPRTGTGFTERLDIALEAIEAEGSEILWVLQKYQPGFASELYRVITRPMLVLVEDDDAPMP